MLVSEFMTKEVFALKPTDSLFRAAQFMFEKNFDGLPVVLDDSTLVGIITQYDLISKGANIHLPTFMKLMNEFSMYKKDKSLLKPELQKIVSLTVKDLMNPEPITVSPDLPMETAATVFSEHHRVNPIPVINSEHKLVGIISRFDIIKLYTGSMLTATTIEREPSIDKKVDVFVDQFSKHFVLVSKIRTKLWFIVSVLFLIVGFAAAIASILRIEINN